MQPGYLFAALPGVLQDGTKFIADAIARGAAAVLAPVGTVVPDEIELITDANPRAAFARLAAEFYGAQPETIFAVTGTNGKTSTANLLKQIWEGLGYRAGRQCQRAQALPPRRARWAHSASSAPILRRKVR